MHERKLNKLSYVKEGAKAVLALVLFLSITTLSVSSVRSSSHAQAVDNPLITLTNQDRLAKGLNPLMPNKQLSNAAATKAQDILTDQYFDHYSPSGKTPWDFIRGAGYGYHRAGENLAVGFNSLDDVEKAWVNSPTHAANIFNVNYQEIGIGMARGLLDGKEVVVIVQMFGQP